VRVRAFATASALPAPRLRAPSALFSVAGLGVWLRGVAYWRGTQFCVSTAAPTVCMLELRARSPAASRGVALRVLSFFAM